MRTPAIPISLLAAFLASCGVGDDRSTPGVATWSGGTSGDPDSTGDDTGSAMTTADTTAPTGGGSGSTGGETTLGGSSGGGIKFDVPSADLPPETMGCQKVDFLFIIDNSGSMSGPQESLVENFPVFITGIQETLADAEQYQVGIVTTDKYAHNPPGCQELGSLVARTPEGDCAPFDGKYASGTHFMTEKDNLPNRFSCAAAVGTQGGDTELPMMALEEVLSRQWNDPGECNEGFLRDDALLVIVLITDEADGPGDPEAGAPNDQGGPSTSPGTPQSWYDAVVAAKDGVEENVVVVSLLEYWGGPCEPANEHGNGQNIKTFTEMFTHGFVGGVCEVDYGPLFNQATSVIETACDTFVPPG